MSGNLIYSIFIFSEVLYRLSQTATYLSRSVILFTVDYLRSIPLIKVFFSTVGKMIPRDISISVVVI